MTGVHSVALVCGGNTGPIAKYLVRTGSSILMADANTDQKTYKKLCEKNNINLRACIDPKIVESGNEGEMSAAVEKLFQCCAANGRFIFGCGVVSYNTPPENVLKLKNIVKKCNPYN